MTHRISISVNGEKVKRREEDPIKDVKIKFGPHYFLSIKEDIDGELSFNLGATHHGFVAKATKVDDQLEKVINLVRERMPERRKD